jgi:hypothetical protein
MVVTIAHECRDIQRADEIAKGSAHNSSLLPEGAK